MQFEYHLDILPSSSPSANNKKQWSRSGRLCKPREPIIYAHGPFDDLFRASKLASDDGMPASELNDGFAEQHGQSSEDDLENVDVRSPSSTDPHVAHPQSRLCQNCAGIDLEQAFAHIDKEDLHDTVPIASIETCLENMANDDCDLCRILQEVIPVEKPGTEFTLYAFPARNHDINVRFLQLYPSAEGAATKYSGSTNKIFCTTSESEQDLALLPRPIHPKFDVSFAKQCLTFCSSNHGHSCSAKAAEPQNLKLIDCATRRIVLAPTGCRYAALSYVWSNESRYSNPERQREASATMFLPSSLSRTIDDAINVVRQLGLAYLWVDRYCIDQGDDAEKHSQMSQMDSIYENADFTIIAAAGDNENSGLSGVSTLERKPTLSVNVQGVTLCTLPGDAQHGVTFSHWFSRGWTFQESILSRRRIVFTQEQVYYECNALRCSESLRFNHNKVHTTTTKSFEKSAFLSAPLTAHHLDIYKSSDFGEETDQYRSLLRYMNLVAVYSEKNLTFETDRLNAFLGVLRNLRSSMPPIRHVAGLAYFPQSLESIDHCSPDLTWISLSLLWLHKGISLDEEDDVEQGRQPLSSIVPQRTEMPSWTWSGWTRQVMFSMTMATALGHPFQSHIRKVTAETDSGVRVDLPGPLDSLQMDLLEKSIPRALFIECLLLPTEPDGLFGIEGDDHYDMRFNGYCAEFYPSCMDINAEQDGDITTIIGFSDGPWAVICVGTMGSFTHTIVVKKTETYWTRVGLLAIQTNMEGLSEGLISTDQEYEIIELR